ncbi:MAG: 30S ribosomal protein S4 [Chloroflexi bacterium]|nr:30S ribosomal protein S4 [Chloroflexota bacterium]
MARYTGPACRLCRRVGQKLFLKGERCFTPRCAIERRRYGPGARPTARRRRLSDRGVQLQEKQKARFTYGILERQFKRYFQEAQKSRGATPDTLLQLLERRLDNVVYRLDFARSRDQARQMVSHGIMTVDGKRASIPSYRVRPGQVIAFGEKSRGEAFVKELAAGSPQRSVPPWLSREAEGLSGKVLRLPEAAELGKEIEARLIVEYYSR